MVVLLHGNAKGARFVAGVWSNTERGMIDAIIEILEYPPAHTRYELIK